MFDFSKAFPERRAVNMVRSRREDAVNALNPFGADLDKRVRHHFEDGDKVEIDAPQHHSHGHKGVIKDARSDTRLEVLLDSGHMVHCCESDLKPEGFPEAHDARIVRIAKQNGPETDARDSRETEWAREATRGSGNVPKKTAAAWHPMFVEEDPNALAKRAKSPFRIGQSVIEKVGERRTGTVMGITASGLLEVKYGSGVSGFCTLDIVEAA